MTRVSFSFATPSRRGFRSLLIAIAMVASLLPFAVATASPALAGPVVAFDMVGSSSSNLISYTNPSTDAFGSPADGFQKYQVGVSATIPFAVFDESLGGFPTASQGIIDESNTDEFFGVTDTVNSDNSAPVSATWVFDIGGATDL
ncbi:MAG: hypothetical protein HKP18_07405, partial [Acidimicrobiia bacterium]|nr:hypothetical protein [Acidimicrobiia bacterium]